ncbi:MAG: DUF2079 domain-containing protein [Bacteroides sp.]|nr:DUF2079 domain-containing protein [Bacteroides sp.]
MIQIVKKYVGFLFYALINGFVAGTGFVLLITSELLISPVSGRTDIFDIGAVGKINAPLYAAIILNFTILFYLLYFLKDKVCRETVPLSALFFSLCILITSPTDRPYLTLALAVTAAVCVYVFKEIFPEKKYGLLEGKNLYVILGALTVMMTAMLSWGCIARFYNFGSSTYDLGIFAQMFESMASDLTQTTTLERGEAMSHFAVHFSPIYYLLLPFYMLFRRPEFLLTAQAAVCFSGIIPLLLLCKRYRYGNTVTFFIGTVFLCYPAFTCASFYDFHENAFLTPLILWVLYFIEKRSMVGAVISGLLLLCVKEDAGVYLAVMGLYALFNRGSSRLMGAVLTIMGISGFIGATFIINTYGEGVMISRFNVFLDMGQDSVKDVALNVLKDPALLFDQLLSAEKLLLVMQMLLPLLFIPVRSRRLSDWLLTVPFVIFNLTTDYGYLSSINYQYVYGSGAMLIFLFAKNFRYEKRKNKTAAAAVMAAAICLMGFSTPKYYNIPRLEEWEEETNASRAVLAELPRDAKIFASTYLTPYLYDCKDVYIYPALYNTENSDPDYVVLDDRLEETAGLIDLFFESGYDITVYEGFVIVMKAPWA